MTTPAARVPAGTPAGGQFAETAHPEADVSLTPAPKPGDRGDGWAIYRTPKGASFNPWRGEIDMKTFLGESLSDLSMLDFDDEDDYQRLDAVVGKFQSVHDRLAATPLYEHDYSFGYVVDEFDGIEDFDEFNEALQGLYNWGDQNRFIVK